ncbi:MAG: hypothetical protein NZ482_01925 [Gloeomargarita sp. SKYG98]|nr:hypothetical protein [Gloeomargarita sp. SKYG98]
MSDKEFEQLIAVKFWHWVMAVLVALDVLTHLVAVLRAPRG